MAKQVKVSFAINSVTLVDAALIEEFLTGNNIPFDLVQVRVKTRKNKTSTNKTSTNKPAVRRARLTMDEVTRAQKLVDKGFSDRTISNKTGLSEGSIWRIRNGTQALLNK